MKQSQTTKILNYLQSHSKGITSFDAFTKFRITRLSSIIYNLKHDGYNISSTMEYKKNKDGSFSNYSRYKLEA